MFRTTTSGSTCSREGRKPPLIELNSSGKVPVLRDGDMILTESAAIITHLGERFPESGLVPGQDHPAERAAYFEWCFFIVAELEQPPGTIAASTASRCRKATPRQHRTHCRMGVSTGHRTPRRTPRGARDDSESGFSGADIPAAHTLRGHRSARIDGGQARLDAYLEAQWQRPAAERARVREG